MELGNMCFGNSRGTFSIDRLTGWEFQLHKLFEAVDGVDFDSYGPDFENETFYRFRDACAAAGITAPIVPGILPIEDFGKTVRFADSCGATVPKWMFKAFGNAGDDASHDLLSIAIATEQCDELMSHGVNDLHFYTLNKSELVFQVCRALGIEPQPAQIAAGCG